MFTPPHMNLLTNVWHTGAGNFLSGPAAYSVLANLSLGRRVTTGPDADFSVGIDAAYRFLAVPKGTDIRGEYVFLGKDTVEVPAGSGYLYLVVDVERVGCGFPNEFLRAWVTPIAPQPLYSTPMIPCGFCTDGPRNMYTLTIAGVNPGTGLCSTCTDFNDVYQLYYVAACQWCSQPFSVCPEESNELLYWSWTKRSLTSFRLELLGVDSGAHYIRWNLTVASGVCSGMTFPLTAPTITLDCDFSAATVVVS